MSLFNVLYLPEKDYEGAPAGDELMDWLNTHYVQPSTEDGDHLSSLKKPWEDPSFWSYLSRLACPHRAFPSCATNVSPRVILRGMFKASVVLLDLLADHPSEDLRRIAEHLVPLVTEHPRFRDYLYERDFVFASQRWKDKVMTLRVELKDVPEDDRDDGFDNWWDRLSDIVGVFEGRAPVLKRLCVELGADWKEMAISWAIFVDPRLRRQELP